MFLNYSVSDIRIIKVLRRGAWFFKKLNSFKKDFEMTKRIILSLAISAIILSGSIVSQGAFAQEGAPVVDESAPGAAPSSATSEAPKASHEKGKHHAKKAAHKKHAKGKKHHKKKHKASN